MLIRVCRAHSLPAAHLLLLHASAWPTLVFGARTFSNSLEATLAAFALATAAIPTKRTSDGRAASWPRYALLGVIIAFGCWVRFTFVLFSAFSAAASIAHDADGLIPNFRTHGARWRASVVLLAAVIFAIPFIGLDCLVYGGGCVSAPWRCVAPLNAAMYNASARNLARHGLHHRLTHALVNLPLLTGPLALAASADLASSLRRRVRCWLHGASSAGGVSPDAASVSNASPDGDPDASPSAQPDGPPPRLRRLLVPSILFPLVALSYAPHQEVRFLLPLMLPMLLLYGHTLAGSAPDRSVAARGRGAWRLVAWLCLQLTLASFYAIVHQGGVAQAVAGLPRSPSHQLAETTSRASRDGRTATAIFFRTYMPPRSLLGIASDVPMTWRIVDLGGASRTELAQAVEATRGRCRLQRRPPVYVVLPAVHADVLYEGGRAQSRWCTVARVLARGRATMAVPVRERRLWPHFSGEDLPRTPSDAALEVFRLCFLQ